MESNVLFLRQSHAAEGGRGEGEAKRRTTSSSCLSRTARRWGPASAKRGSAFAKAEAHESPTPFPKNNRGRMISTGAGDH